MQTSELQSLVAAAEMRIPRLQPESKEEEEEGVGCSSMQRRGGAPVCWPKPSWCWITASGQPPPFTAS